MADKTEGPSDGIEFEGGARKSPLKTPAKADEGLLSLIQDAANFAGRTSKVSVGLFKAMLEKQIERNRPSTVVYKTTGAYVKELRELVGVTREDLAKAVDVRDSSLIEAVESGTATMSFELILRLASILARNDPLPFIFRLLRSYYPEVWDELEGWGATGLYDKVERERLFINILRQYDEARSLTHDEFMLVLGYTDAAFKMALGFVLQSRGKDLTDPQPDDPEPKKSK